MKKYNYTELFQNLYEFYTSNGDNDRTWYFIIKELERKGYINCQLHSSKLYYSLYDDGYSTVTSSIIDAFRKYKPESNASLYTWTTRLFRQSLWRYIKERCVNDEKDAYKTDDFSSYEENNYVRSVEDDMIDKENKTLATNLIQKILDIAIENDIYKEVFCTKKGILGYKQEIYDEKVANALGLTVTTIKQANISNKIRIRVLKEMIKTYNINEINKENYNEFRKKFLKRNK